MSGDPAVILATEAGKESILAPPDPAPSGWDDGLTASFVASDERALAAAYREFAPLVHTLALRSLGNRSTADDVTQEVFIRVWRSRSTFNPHVARLPAWIVGITRNAIADAQSASTREIRKVLAVAGVQGAGETDPGLETAEVWADRLLLDGELDRLGEPQGYQEVWLIAPDLSRLVSLGVMNTNAGTFQVPAGLELSDFPIVDVSDEPVDGNPAHSSVSTVRGTLTT